MVPTARAGVLAGTVIARAYRRLGRAEGIGASPLQQRVVIALSESDEAMRAVATAPARRQGPASILAGLHDLALAGRAPELSAAHASGDCDAAAGAAVDTLLGMTDAVSAVVARRQVLSDETGR